MIGFRSPVTVSHASVGPSLGVHLPWEIDSSFGLLKGFLCPLTITCVILLLGLLGWNALSGEHLHTRCDRDHVFLRGWVFHQLHSFLCQELLPLWVALESPGAFHVVCQVVLHGDQVGYLLAIQWWHINFAFVNQSKKVRNKMKTFCLVMSHVTSYVHYVMTCCSNAWRFTGL